MQIQLASYCGIYFGNLRNKSQPRGGSPEDCAILLLLRQIKPGRTLAGIFLLNNADNAVRRQNDRQDHTIGSLADAIDLLASAIDLHSGAIDLLADSIGFLQEQSVHSSPQ
jgi:hypothetical protein